MLWNNEVFRYLLTGLSSLRIDYKVDQQYRPTPLCLHPHIDQSLPLRINALFTVEIRQSVQGLPDNYGDKWFSRLDDALQPQDKPGRQFICLLSIWWHNTDVVPNSELLLGHSKGNARVEIPETLFFRWVANRSQVLVTHAQPFDSDACVTFWLMSTWYSVMADDEKLSRSKMGTDTVYNTLKTHTKYAHIVRGRATLKDVECFPNGLVRETCERSLY